MKYFLASLPAWTLLMACSQAGAWNVKSPQPTTSGATSRALAAEESPTADHLQNQLLDLINESRASAGIPPLTLDARQSGGSGSCVGSLGHSRHMAQTKNMAHDQFPQDICYANRACAENIGYASGQDPATAVETIHRSMMNEGPAGGHYQNIMNPDYNTIGIGLVEDNGTLWLTEDFLEL